MQNGQWVVDLKLKDGAKGLGAWNTWASKCYSQEADCPTGGMAIVLDGTVIAAPVPQTPFFSDTNVQVSGGGNGFQKGEAKDLARVLKYGSVPVELKPQAAQTVSATLGKDSLHAGLIAGFVGVLLVLLLMILYYRALAILVVVGLFLGGCLLWTVHLDAVEDLGSLPDPGRRHRHHRVDRHHRRLLRRVPGATEGRRPLGQVAAGVDAARASRARGARSSRPTSCR